MYELYKNFLNSIGLTIEDGLVFVGDKPFLVDNKQLALSTPYVLKNLMYENKQGKMEERYVIFQPHKENRLRDEQPYTAKIIGLMEINISMATLAITQQLLHAATSGENTLDAIMASDVISGAIRKKALGEKDVNAVIKWITNTIKDGGLVKVSIINNKTIGAVMYSRVFELYSKVLADDDILDNDKSITVVVKNVIRLALRHILDDSIGVVAKVKDGGWPTYKSILIGYNEVMSNLIRLYKGDDAPFSLLYYDIADIVSEAEIEAAALLEPTVTSSDYSKDKPTETTRKRRRVTLPDEEYEDEEYDEDSFEAAIAREKARMGLNGSTTSTVRATRGRSRPVPANDRYGRPDTWGGGVRVIPSSAPMRISDY